LTLFYAAEDERQCGALLECGAAQPKSFFSVWLPFGPADFAACAVDL
jgi:hypothetical protein